jgi:hypothetical protein
MASREAEIRAVVEQLDVILAKLRKNVDALTGILIRPAPSGGGESDERLVQQ